MTNAEIYQGSRMTKRLKSTAADDMKLLFPRK